MTDDEKKNLILSFIQKHSIGVISTIHPSGGPESAVIGISESSNLELIFDTLPTSRKYANLKNGSNVAMVIGWDENITVQYEGVAQELSGDDAEAAQKIHLAKLPGERKFIERGSVVFKIIPKWIRYSDFNKDPWEIFELSF